MHWRKSSYSDAHGGNCVECRAESTRMLLRDSQHRHDGHLAVPAAEWQAFLHAVRVGEV